jgi:MoaE-MoaD fusion protein
MRVHLLPFGAMKDLVHAGSLELPTGASVADLLRALQGRATGPSSEQMLSRIAISVNAEYARPERILTEGDEVGLLPPVSGGSGKMAVKTYLTREPIPTSRLAVEARSSSDGAVVVFDGVVRDNTGGRQTLYLDYEAYEEMAERQMAELAVRATADFGVRAVTLVHRLGRIEIGGTSVLIVVASAHRAAAFDACRWLIDTLKTTVPIWKKETFADGAVWADGEPFPERLAASEAVRSLESSS